MFRNSRATAPFEQGFHPEFGYFSPSAALRRRVRVVAKLALVGAAVVVAAALALSSALFPPPVREALREEPVAMQASAPRPPDAIAPGQAVALPAPAASVPSAQAAVASDPAMAAHAQAACEDLSASFLSPQCRSGRKSRLTRSAHAASRRVATGPLGQVDAPLAGVPQYDPGGAPAVANTSAAPPEKPAAATKKPAKTAHKRPPVPEIAAGDPTVAPPPPRPAFDLFGLFRVLPRLPDPPFSTSWR